MEKILEDKEIMAQVLETTRYSAHKFSKKIGVHHNTIYNILQNVHGLSADFKDKILTAFPEINPEFLKYGKLPIIKPQNTLPESDQHINDVLSMPQRLANIEKDIKLILEILTNQ